MLASVTSAIFYWSTQPQTHSDSSAGGNRLVDFLLWGAQFTEGPRYCTLKSHLPIGDYVGQNKAGIRLLCQPTLAHRLCNSSAGPSLNTEQSGMLSPFSPSLLHSESALHCRLMPLPAFPVSLPVSFHTGIASNNILAHLMLSWYLVLKGLILT